MAAELVTAQVILLMAGEEVGEATVEIRVDPGNAIVNWGLVEVELEAQFDLQLGDNVTCRFKDPCDAIAFIGAKEPMRIGKDQ